MIPDVTHEAIIEEIQAFRREHAARFGYDLRAIFEDLKEAERLSGRTYTTRSPRPYRGPERAATAASESRRDAG